MWPLALSQLGKRLAPQSMWSRLPRNQRCVLEPHTETREQVPQTVTAGAGATYSNVRAGATHFHNGSGLDILNHNKKSFHDGSRDEHGSRDEPRVQFQPVPVGGQVYFPSSQKSGCLDFGYLNVFLQDLQLWYHDRLYQDLDQWNLHNRHIDHLVTNCNFGICSVLHFLHKGNLPLLHNWDVHHFVDELNLRHLDCFFSASLGLRELVPS